VEERRTPMAAVGRRVARVRATRAKDLEVAASMMRMEGEWSEGMGWRSDEKKERKRGKKKGEKKKRRDEPVDQAFDLCASTRCGVLRGNMPVLSLAHDLHVAHGRTQTPWMRRMATPAAALERCRRLRQGQGRNRKTLYGVQHTQDATIQWSLFTCHQGFGSPRAAVQAASGRGRPWSNTGFRAQAQEGISIRVLHKSSQSGGEQESAGEEAGLSS
jgi:hypothetical protein